MIRPLIETDGLGGETDEALMKAITDRKQSALEELYGRYGKTLKAVITHVVHEEAEAQAPAEALGPPSQTRNSACRISAVIGRTA